MKKNVGDFDAYCRLVGGLTLFGFGVIKKSKPFIFLGSMKIAEGVTRWCPMLSILGMSTTESYNESTEEIVEEATK